MNNIQCQDARTYCRITPVTVKIEIELLENQPHSTQRPGALTKRTGLLEKGRGLSNENYEKNEAQSPCSSNIDTTLYRWRSTFFMTRKACMHRMTVKNVEEVSNMIVVIDNISGAETDSMHCRCTSATRLTAI
jgi:hypothetical protein